MQFIQFMETARDESEAIVMLHGLKQQIDFRGGRMLPPDPAKGNCWRVQAFFEDAPDFGWLPDGCRRVLVPPSLWGRMGMA